MSRARKVDARQKTVVECFRQLGCSVELLYMVGGGFPDLLVGLFGENVLVEVKEEKKGLRPNQSEWAASWRGGPVIVVHNEEEALALVRRVRASLSHIGRALKEMEKK